MRDWRDFTDRSDKLHKRSGEDSPALAYCLSLTSDTVCRRLMNVPGVGPLTAVAFRAGVDDPARFPCSRDVAAYFGLTPRRVQSGHSSYQTSISRYGDKEVRTALYQAAQVLLSTVKRPSALKAWTPKLSARRGHRYAATACARKLAVILHRMWINGRDFSPEGAFPSLRDAANLTRDQGNG